MVKNIFICFILFIVISFDLKANAHQENLPEILIYTSQTKPYQYLDADGEVVGYQVDLVRAFMEKTGLDYKIQITNLNRGLRNVLQNDHSLIFSLRRTASRENQYHWIEPLLKHEHFLISLNDDKFNNLSKGDIINGDYKGICKDGSWQCEEFANFGFKEENILKIANVEISDITRLVLRGRAQAAIDAKAEFLSIISHEIRTPLNGIMGMANLLSETKPNDDQKNYIESIKLSGDNLLSIINDVLDISKIELGDVTLDKEPFNFQTLTKNVVKPFNNLAQEQGISLSLKAFPENLDFVAGDQKRFRQILWNILSNAVKFTDKGGITVSVTQEDKNKFKKYKDADILIRTEIKDTGIGILENKLEDIFQPFVQEDKIITRVFGGSGIGLAITHKLVEVMGGEIIVESIKGKGSTFTVLIPFDYATEEQIVSLQKREAGEFDLTIGEGLRALVVEDSDINAEITKSYLQKFGAEVEVAENGLKAIDKVKSFLPHIIYMDIHMPEMDGIEATKRIRKTVQGATTPIVGITADAFSERRESFLKAGIDSVITKPFDDEQLYETIEQIGKRDQALTRKIGATNARYVPLQKPVPNVPSHIEKLMKDKKEKKLPIGDKENINKFIKLFGRDKLISLLEKAPEHLDRRLAELKEGIEKEDAELIRLSAHAIKGTTGQLYGIRLSNEAAKI